jgi:hypothetical protein
LAVNWPLTSAIALVALSGPNGTKAAGAEVGSIEPSGHQPGPIPLTSITEVSRAASAGLAKGPGEEVAGAEV